MELSWYEVHLVVSQQPPSATLSPGASSDVCRSADLLRTQSYCGVKVSLSAASSGLCGRGAYTEPPQHWLH